MIVLNVTYTMKDGVKPQDFVSALESKGLAPYCRQEKGNICYDYFYPADGSDTLLLLEKWADAGSLTAHSQTENFKQIGLLKDDFVKHTDIMKFTE